VHSLCLDSEGSIYLNQALGTTDLLKYRHV